MNHTAFEQLIRYVLMAIVVTGSLGIASGLVIWAIKGYLNMRTEIPRAACSYIVMQDLIEHCNRQSGGLRDVMETKLDSAIAALTARLKAGDQIFEDHRERLKELEQRLTVKIEALDILSRDLRVIISEKASRESKQRVSP